MTTLKLDTSQRPYRICDELLEFPPVAEKQGHDHLKRNYGFYGSNIAYNVDRNDDVQLNRNSNLVTPLAYSMQFGLTASSSSTPR